MNDGRRYVVLSFVSSRLNPMFKEPKPYAWSHVVAEERAPAMIAEARARWSDVEVSVLPIGRKKEDA